VLFDEGAPELKNTPSFCSRPTQLYTRRKHAIVGFIQKGQKFVNQGNAFMPTHNMLNPEALPLPAAELDRPDIICTLYARSLLCLTMRRI
jgi:hypothetical protein